MQKRFLARALLLLTLPVACSKIVKSADDALNGRVGKHFQDVSVRNAGTQDLTFTAKLGLPNDGCAPELDQKQVSLHAGGTASLHLELECRGHPQAWWSVNLAKSYDTGYVTAALPQSFGQLGTQFYYGNRDKNIQLPAVVVAEKLRVWPIPLSQPVLDQVGVAWISKQDFYPGDGTSWALFISIPKLYAGTDLYIYMDQNADKFLDMNDPNAVNAVPLIRSTGISLGVDAVSGAITVDCTEDGCLVN